MRRCATMTMPNKDEHNASCEGHEDISGASTRPPIFSPLSTEDILVYRKWRLAVLLFYGGLVFTITAIAVAAAPGGDAVREPRAPLSLAASGPNVPR